MSAEGTHDPLAPFTDEEMAYHEAGHAVAYHLGGGAVSRLSVLRSDPGRGTRLTPASAPPDPKNPADLQRLVSSLMAGEAAMAIYGTDANKITVSGESDRAAALRLATEAGLEAPSAYEMIERERERIRGRLQEEPVWRKVEALARALAQEKTLDGERIEELLR